LVDATKPAFRLILSPEPSYELHVYVDQLASAFAKFGSYKSKRRKPTYAIIVFEFIDGSASEENETSDSSDNDDSVAESTAT